MSNIHRSILEKLTALNIDIYHYEEMEYEDEDAQHIIRRELEI